MSLDVDLKGEPEQIECECQRCCNKHDRTYTKTFYDSNITHNLGAMAQAAGIYKHLWRPEEIGITKANQLIQPLREGLGRLHSEPDTFKALNPSNGWGSYESLVSFVSQYLAACESYPDANVEVLQ